MHHLSRREFMFSAAALGMAARSAGAQDAGRANRKFTLALVGGAIGVEGTLRQQLDWATTYGFESIEPAASELTSMSSGEIDALTAEMKERRLQWAVTYVPVNLREQSDANFAKKLAELEPVAKAWQAAGVTRVKTAILPFNHELNYLENFRIHTKRLQSVAKFLDGHGLRFGLEYLAPKMFWTRDRHPFIHTMAETRELIAATGQDNLGLVLDSWHWYCARESVDDILALEAKDVVSCDLNDAPAGIEIDHQIDNQRRLPATTGVIDAKGFLDALVKIGFDGSIMAEPFDDNLNAMGDDEALKLTAEAMKRAFELIG
jgi:sugar phosphate isomerase/epimerase